MISKMHISLVLLVGFFVLPLLVVGQSEKKQGESFLGEFSGEKYTNDFFGFSLTPLPEMYVFSGDEREAYKKGGIKMFSKDLEKGRAAFEKAASQEVLLFSLTVTKPGPTGVSSLNIGVAEQPAGVTAALVCDAAAEFFIRNPSYTLASKTRTLKRAGSDFAQVEFTFASGEHKLSLRYYATMRKGYSVTFVITHLSKNDLDSLEKVLDSLEFF